MYKTHTKPHIMVIATGGTIAGVADDSGAYQCGVLHIDKLLDSISKVYDLAEIHTVQPYSIDSADIGDREWLILAQCVNEALKNPLYVGVVIAHGTDSMEESAFFVDCLFDTYKPIIFTGAMRPSNALGYDGARNLYSAILLATCADSMHRGVMICMNDRIIPARYAIKAHTLNVDAFSSPCDLGYIAHNAVHFFAITKPRQNTLFSLSDLLSDVDSIDSINADSLADSIFIESKPISSPKEPLDWQSPLPRVEILYAYGNNNLAVVAEALFRDGVKGLVIAGSGAGSIHKALKDTLIALIKKGLVVVISSRVNSGAVVLNAQDIADGFISSGYLNPPKARILLSLALTKTKDITEIATFFYI